MFDDVSSDLGGIRDTKRRLRELTFPLLLSVTGLLRSLAVSLSVGRCKNLSP